MRTSFPLLFFLLLLGGCVGNQDEPSPPEATYGNLAPDVEYVGQDTCGACHADKFETYTTAQMGRSFKPALPAHSAADWDGVSPVYDDRLNLYYQAFRRGDSLYVMEYRVSEGDTIHKRVEKIDYIVGSGQHTNSHMMEVNGFFYQMPLTWYAQDGRWDLPPGFENNNSRFSRPITQACMGCHNGVADFVPGSENRFMSVPHGIDCERCHGPGALHVEEKRAGELVDVETEVDYSIVNPAKLPIERQFDVCQRCHMQGATVYQDGKDPYDFRPGMALDTVMNVFAPRYSDSTKRFIMASHPDRLQMSECFIASHEEDSGVEPMTCTTCHDPHLPIEALGAEHYQSVCQSCHAEAADGENVTVAFSQRPSAADSNDVADACSAPERVRLTQDNDCAACHMPKSGSSDIPHVSITDHFIRVVETAEEGDTLTEQEFVALASLIQADPTEQQMAEGYMTYFEEISNVPRFLDSAGVHLDRARMVEADQSLAPSLIRYYFLQNEYDELVRLSRSIDASQLEDGWSHYRLGQAHARSGNMRAAVEHFRHAVERQPENLRFRNRLGMAYTSAGQFDNAIAMFDAVLNANPRFADAYNNRGFSLAMSGDLAEAETDFLKAIDLNPDAFQAMANLASLYINLGRNDEARPYVERLLASDPQNAGYRQLEELIE